MQDRVFGIETEYAIIWHPRGRSAARPTNLEIYRRIEAALLRRVRTLPQIFSLRAKGGRFLENGGSFNYEAGPEQFEYGLLELASPECRDPDTLVAHERAKDELAEELTAEVALELERAGWKGEVRLGKNNVDSAGHTFGSHESYWVEDRLSPGALALFVPVWLALWAISAPLVALLLAAPWLLLFGMALAGLLALGLGALLRGIWPAGSAALFRRLERFARSVDRHPGELVRRLQWLSAPLYPLLDLHSAVYNRFHFRGIRRDLTAFLVTRALFAGAGAVAFDGGPLLRVAQRPPFLRALARIFPEGDTRPLYETRDLFFAPLSALRSRRRLHLLLGDANLCEWALWLRVASTALVLEAIEARPDAGWPELAEPLEALRAVGADPDLRAQLRLVDGAGASALQIQRAYLEGVNTLLANQAGLAEWKRLALARWREALDALAGDPASLADRVDWLAKRRLVHGEVPDPVERAALERRGRELIAAALPDDPAERRLRAMAFRAWRTDLRYHELGPRGGFRRLEARGQVRRLSDPDAVRAARSEPPADTRAWARGQAIKWASAHAEPGSASWDRVRLGKRGTRALGDPLDPLRGAD
jgi:proteasome accessory factor A